MYKAGGINRPNITHAIELLKKCEVDEEETILRTWDLICLATVVAPGSGNNLLLDYVASMEDPTRTHEFAWDEHLLELAMEEVQKIQDKLAAPIPKILKPGSDKLDFWIVGPYAMLGVSLSHSSSFLSSFYVALHGCLTTVFFCFFHRSCTWII